MILGCDKGAEKGLIWGNILVYVSKWKILVVVSCILIQLATK